MKGSPKRETVVSTIIRILVKYYTSKINLQLDGLENADIYVAEISEDTMRELDNYFHQYECWWYEIKTGYIDGSTKVLIKIGQYAKE